MSFKTPKPFVLSAALGLIVSGLSGAIPAAAATACTIEVSPGKSIPEAVNNQPAGAVICLKSGTHRVDKTVSPKDRQTLRGLPGSRMVGSVVLSRWQSDGNLKRADSALPSRYASAGQCETAGSTLCQQAEAVFADGVPLTPVSSRDQVRPGTYFADYSSGSVFVQAAAGTQPVYEIARTRTAISSRGNSVRLEGLTIQGFANLPQKGAVEVSGPNWTVSGNDITKNHGVGLILARGDNALITGNRVHSNGQLGIAQWQSYKARIENNEVLNNNTRGFWIADWESGGIKITESSSTVQNNTVANNLGIGIWADEAVDGVSILGNTITANAADGVRFEISRNGEIRDNTVLGNGLGLKRGGGTTLMSGAGINVNTASNVRVSGNRLAANLNGIGLQMRARGAGPWGTYKLNGIRVTGNTVDMSTPASPSGAVSGLVRAGQVQDSVESADVVFSGNTYVYPSAGAAKMVRAGENLTFAAWQSKGFDRDGRLLTSPPGTTPPAPPEPGPAPVVPEPTPGTFIARDDFSRVAARGLGRAQTGGTWTTAGAGSLYSVAQGAGNLTMSRPGYLPSAYLQSISSVVTDTSVSFNLDKAPGAGQVYVSVVGRSVPGNGEYRAKLVLSGQRGAVSIVRTDSRGAETVIGGEQQLQNMVLTKPMNVRLQVTDASPTRLRVKAWQQGSPEPAAWQREVTDNTSGLQKGGAVGILSSLSGNATGFPLTLQVQDWSTLAPGNRP